MKSKWLFLVLALLMGVAQVWGQSRFDAGVLGGVNFSRIASDELEQSGTDFSNRTAFGAGAVFDWRFAENFSLRSEPMYLQKGSKLQNNAAANTEGTLKTAYFSVPVFLKYNIESRAVRPYLMAGPSVDFLLTAKQKFGNNEEDVKDDFKDVEFALNFGGGLNIPAGNSSLFVEARYDFGLNDINEARESVDEDAEVKSRGILLLAGVTIPLGGAR